MEVLAIVAASLFGLFFWLKVSRKSEPEETPVEFVAPAQEKEHAKIELEHESREDELRKASRREKGMVEYIEKQIARRREK